MENPSVFDKMHQYAQASTFYPKFWFPSMKELTIFITILFLLWLVFMLFHNNRIQIIVNNTSRCVRDNRQQDSENKVYTVTAVNRSNKPLYSVTYDLTARKHYTECKCPTGNIQNTFMQQLPAYNFATLTTSGPETVPTCHCDDDYTKDQPITYSGYGPLADFIESNGKLVYMFTGDKTDGRCSVADVGAAAAATFDSSAGAGADTGGGDGSGGGSGVGGGGGSGDGLGDLGGGLGAGTGAGGMLPVIPTSTVVPIPGGLNSLSLVNLTARYRVLNQRITARAPAASQTADIQTLYATANTAFNTNARNALITAINSANNLISAMGAVTIPPAQIQQLLYQNAYDLTAQGADMALVNIILRDCYRNIRDPVSWTNDERSAAAIILNNATGQSTQSIEQISNTGIMFSILNANEIGESSGATANLPSANANYNQLIYGGTPSDNQDMTNAASAAFQTIVTWTAAAVATAQAEDIAETAITAWENAIRTLIVHPSATALGGAAASGASSDQVNPAAMDGG